ncbi:kinase-like domain-containing protein [Podospora appendiculata]|uniref:Kinase-like domain-containing protein n=1 Tax=Podospora appendiculata TaxID=314037 RepID=A0AAE0XJ49_9PEZI|nr:kinase-like domain-containing protein [Podospora appendiculata]
MAPQIAAWKDLFLLAEEFSSETKEFLYTTFSYVDEQDFVYHGQICKPKLEITLEEASAALVRLPDEDIFPELPPDGQLTVAPETWTSDVYIKRSRLSSYEDYREQDALMAHALELVSQHPHPGLIGYHGCRVRRGRITGLVLEKHGKDLNQHTQDVGPVDKAHFMDALEDAVRHLHSLGLAHNDINPANILVNKAGLPVLVDFGFCRKVGQKLGASRGTPGWIDEGDDYVTSEERHDLFGLAKIRAWLDDPVPLR